MPSPPLSPADAVRIAQRARRLLRCGKINHTAYIVIDNLLWSARPKGASSASISYNGLARLTHLAKATVGAAIKALEAARLITKIRRRILVPWHQGGARCRQLANEYKLLPPSHCEFSQQPVIKSNIVNIRVPAVSGYSIEAARAAMEARCRVIEARMAMK